MAPPARHSRSCSFPRCTPKQRWVYPALLALACACANAAHADVACPNGARVSDTKYCKYFVRFTSFDTPSDPRINSAMGISPADQVRSMALVVAIGRYPHLPASSQLKAAQNDGNNLEAFLTNNQRFDEVIVLRDEDATKEAINYFLGNYFRKEMALYPNKSRFVFAFSGHGTPQGDNGASAKIALSAATSEDDYDNVLDLTTLRDSIYALDRQSFHVLLLLNSCYGGAIFSLAPEGGNENDISAAGARAITAAEADSLAYALPGDKNGSIFFDTIINGVTSGQADTYPPRGLMVNGKKQPGGGYVRFGPLLAYISDNIAVLNSEQPGHPFRPPWAGIVEPIDAPAVVAKGGFFFLTSAPGATQASDIVAANAPSAASSGVQAFAFPTSYVAKPQAGQAPAQPTASPAPPPVQSAPPPTLAPPVPPPTTPDRVTFYSPFHYNIRGVDASHYGGAIDWQKLKAEAHNISFVYLKATEGATLKDPLFERNWADTAAAGFYHGAYHVLTFCTPIAAQYANITKTVPKDPAALPITINPGYTWDSRRKTAHVPQEQAKEKACYTRLGPQKAWTRAEKLADMLAQHYGKRPVIMVNHESGITLQDHFPGWPLWVVRLGGDPSPTDRAWTFWQYATPALGKFDFDAFSGTKAQFDEVRRGVATATTP